MKKRLRSLLFIFLIGVILPFGCMANNPNSTQQPDQTTSANVLSVYNYSTYIEPAVITEFEQKYKTKVQYDTFESPDDLYAKMKAGNPGYDLIFPTDYLVTIMGKEGILEPLNHDKIPNLKNIDQKFLNPPFDPDNKYSLPYQWGTLGLGYNLKKTGKELESWQEIFNPKYKGKVAFTEEMRMMMGGILIYLGYDPNTTNPEEINKAKDFIIKNKDNIAAFAPDTGQVLLDQGQVDIAVEWSGDIFQVMEENPDLRYVIPKEGTIIWVDNFAIPKGAPHPDLAEQFINFLLAPEISAKTSNYIKYGTPNKVSIEKGLINKSELNNPAIYPPPEVYKKLIFINDVGEATRLYDEAWTEAKLGVGK
ncbi:ABC transporter substrate-binding protein [Aphanothece hegewaldii CCALA 016]|uniref:ABC transporter substrate-binding protein n=1 Tax=Aphanothece hegewaldii CCALA 016 TaxID=2107694 RepID=A0A2T1LS52_9CHRO|nr:spermidine/putrescine ABC transporter substrate-binding protein [Aphanothece hegewaldii]PSF32263.1 ABC transporter substrate-binding protein [Aphanothece hegewaldii CCALA 016]